MSTTEWTENDDGRPAWVPTWVPSVQAIQSPFKPSVQNMEANLKNTRKSTAEKAIEITLLVLEAVAFLMVILGMAPGALPYNLTPLTGLALAVVGIFYFVTAAATIGVRLSFLFTPTKPEACDGSNGASSTKLVTEGVYKHCRHPMYLGTLAFALGISMLTLSFGRLFWFVVLYLVLDAKADIEELILMDTFKGDYSAYCKQTPKFIPGLNLLVNFMTSSSYDALEEGVVVDKSVVDKIAE